MKRFLTWRRTAAAAVLPLALTGLSACGGDDAETADDASGASAQLEESSEVEDELGAGDEVPNEQFVELMTSAMEEASTARTTMSLESSGVEMEGEGVVDYSTTPPAMKMTMESDVFGDDPLQMVMIDNTLYMQMPDLGTKYVALDLDDPDNPLGSMMTDSMDPAKQAEMMQAGLESVTFTGEEDVDGQSMERYSAVVDPRKGLQDMEGMDDVPQNLLPEQMDYDIWFDDEGRMRQMIVDMGDLGLTQVTLDDWGTEVDIEAPPADQVTTMDKLMGDMTSMG